MQKARRRRAIRTKKWAKRRDIRLTVWYILKWDLVRYADIWRAMAEV
jgi:hypothetical protein